MDKLKKVEQYLIARRKIELQRKKYLEEEFKISPPASQQQEEFSLGYRLGKLDAIELTLEKINELKKEINHG